MQISIYFVLSVETKAEAQIKLAAIKRAFAAAGIELLQIQIDMIDRQTIDYSQIVVV